MSKNNGRHDGGTKRTGRRAAAAAAVAFILFAAAPFVNERTVDLADAWVLGIERVMHERCELIHLAHGL